MDDYPRILENESSVIVEFDAHSRQQTRQPLKMVLDFGPTGEINGIEIINLALHVGLNGLQVIERVVRSEGEPPRYGYDDEADAFYLRLRNGASADQRSIEGYALINTERQITALGVEWS